MEISHLDSTLAEFHNLSAGVRVYVSPRGTSHRLQLRPYVPAAVSVRLVPRSTIAGVRVIGSPDKYGESLASRERLN